MAEQQPMDFQKYGENTTKEVQCKICRDKYPYNHMESHVVGVHGESGPIEMYINANSNELFEFEKLMPKPNFEPFRTPTKKPKLRTCSAETGQTEVVVNDDDEPSNLVRSSISGITHDSKSIPRVFDNAKEWKNDAFADDMNKNVAVQDVVPAGKYMYFDFTNLKKDFLFSMF